MPEMTSKTSHQYAGRDLSKGDRFDVEPQHVPLLLALGRIEPEEVEYVTADEPVADGEMPGTLHVPHVKRKYTKRKAA